jgi:hypothetical protein
MMKPLTEDDFDQFFGSPMHEALKFAFVHVSEQIAEQTELIERVLDHVL